METVSPSENNSRLPESLDTLTFLLTLVLISLSIVIMVGEIRYLIISKDIKSSTNINQNDTSNSQIVECNTDLNTWKPFTYMAGKVKVSFKYPSCWQQNTDERFDEYAPLWHFVNSSIDLSYSDPNKLYKGPTAETEEKKFSSFTLGYGYGTSVLSQTVSKVVEQSKIAGYPATKTIYKGIKNDGSIVMYANTGIVYEIPHQIERGKLGITFTIQFYDSDKTDYSKIADLIGSTFEIKQ